MKPSHQGSVWFAHTILSDCLKLNHATYTELNPVVLHIHSLPDCIMSKKFHKALLASIEDIPDSKLEGVFPSITKTIWHDDNYQLDMQTITTGEPRCYNLQIQVNKQALFTSDKRAGKNGASVGKVLMPVDDPLTPAEIKELLKQSVIEFGERSGQF